MSGGFVGGWNGGNEVEAFLSLDYLVQSSFRGGRWVPVLCCAFLLLLLRRAGCHDVGDRLEKKTHTHKVRCGRQGARGGVLVHTDVDKDEKLEDQPPQEALASLPCLALYNTIHAWAETCIHLPTCLPHTAASPLSLPLTPSPPSQRGRRG